MDYHPKTLNTAKAITTEELQKCIRNSLVKIQMSNLENQGTKMEAIIVIKILMGATTDP